MTAKTDGGAAFPRPAGDYNGTRNGNLAQAGISMRDYFAAKAMQGLLAQSMGSALQSDPDAGAQYAYRMADAMLAARETRP